MNVNIDSKLLVISGPQGCGKSTKARQIAVEPFREIDVGGLSSAFELSDVLLSRPKTLIIDDLPRTRAQKEMLKMLVRSDTWVCARKGLPSEHVPVPHLILCTSDDYRDFDLGDRSFTVLHLQRPLSNYKAT